jgi:hypothetical protein
MKNEEIPPREDDGSVTPPHGDEVVNEMRNASRKSDARADDPDNDRPAD